MGGRPGGCGVLVAVVAATGCAPVFKGEVTQPNPVAEPTETLRTSEQIDVVTGDMELNVPRPPIDGAPASLMHLDKFKLHNVASFMVVSRDRLRFHVQLEHKWQEWADLNNWTAYLEDDRGHRYQPEGLDHATTQIVTQMWDFEVRSANHNQFGDITSVNDDGYKNRQPLGSISIFRGHGDFVFYQRDLLRPDCRWLRLVIQHPGESFEFRWDFADEVATAP
ncbi:MAG TPA: hypothetical protein VL463_36975 [Kofleriaceae bacterium]|jgi:hypothetical protein|nr:hypothetical protein [Kofleriaceae bacterium]